jgi:hypothetical protein
MPRYWILRLSSGPTATHLIMNRTWIGWFAPFELGWILGCPLLKIRFCRPVSPTARTPAADLGKPVKNKTPGGDPRALLSRNWVQGLDLNQRPSGYEPDELPGCSTLQQRRRKVRAVAGAVNAFLVFCLPPPDNPPARHPTAQDRTEWRSRHELRPFFTQNDPFTPKDPFRAGPTSLRSAGAG